jgi:CRP/FNR family transcriptional regulator, cyclic AMP receptor protein
MTEYDSEGKLASVDLFSALSNRQLRKLLDRAREVRHGSGHEIATEGQGALAFHLLLDGHVRVDVHGRNVRTLGPGDYFGEISMIDGKPRSATITATDDVTALAIPHQEFERLVADEPDFARALLGALCARLREAESRPSAP